MQSMRMADAERPTHPCHRTLCYHLAELSPDGLVALANRLEQTERNQGFTRAAMLATDIKWVIRNILTPALDRVRS